MEKMVGGGGGGGVVNRKGWGGLLDAHWHIISLPGDLFCREEIHSSERAFFITVQGHNSDFSARTHTHTRARQPGSDGLMCYLTPPPSSTSLLLPPVSAVGKMYG